MDEATKKLIETLVAQNAQLLEMVTAQREIIDDLYELVEELTVSVGNLNLPVGDGYEIN